MSVTDPEWLKSELAKPGRSQSGLARAMGLDSSAINRLVNGGRELKAREIEQIEGYLASTRRPGAEGNGAALTVRAGRVTLDIRADVSVTTAAKILALIEADRP